VWVLLTLAECDLHAHLLTGDAGALKSATKNYVRAAGRVGLRERDSATRQLRLMHAAGDDPAVIGPLLEAFG
jgi:hypothetical protein